MDTKSRASQADICSSPKRNAADSSSKEKKILQGRRQQRHSTEIGSEYHRWWVVRNALGFETNEHIAGLLLDGQPVQEFLIRLMGYLRSAKGKSFTEKRKKRFKSNSMCVRNIVEGSLSQVNMAKLCPPVAHHESQSTDAALSSHAQCTAETSADEHQHRCVDKSTSCLEPVKDMLTQVGKDHEEKTLENIVEEGVQTVKVAREKCLYDDQSPCSYLQMTHHSKEKEQTDLQQEKVTQQYYAHLQAAVDRECEVEETQSNHQSLQESSQQNQKVVAAQLLKLAPQPPHTTSLAQQPLQGLQAGRQLDKNDLQIGTLPQNLQPTNAACHQQQELAAKDDEQHKVSSVNQQQDLDNNQTCNSTEKKKLGQWWKSGSLNPGTSFKRNAGETASLRDGTFGMFGKSSEASETCDRSDGELGFLLTDTLKMLPCIDDDISDLPLPEKDNNYIKRHVNQIDIKINSGVTLTSGRQVQGCQTNSSMTIPTEQVTPCVVGTSRVQSLLAGTQAPPQKVKETQTVGTSTQLYNEIRINVNNTRQVSDVKSHMLVGNPSFQSIQPAVFSAGEKSSSTSLGTPVILYPASTFPSNDSSLASLSSLVHNIVYNSYGTIIKPLSLTSLSSSSSVPCNPPLLPPLSVATVDSSSQRKSIAAALPVLSSQLSAGRRTILPFYISHTAVSNMSKTTNPPGFSRSQAWSDTMIVSTATETPGSTSSVCSQPQSQTTTVPTQHPQPVVPSFTSANKHPGSSISNHMTCSELPSPVNQVKMAGVPSYSSTDDFDIGQVRNETLLSPTFTCSPALVAQMDKKKGKSDYPEQYLFKPSLMYTVGQVDKQLDFYTRLTSNQSTKPAVVASNICDQKEQSTTSWDTKYKSTDPPCCSESGVAKSIIIEASSENNTSVTMSPGTILNSLLANKDVSCSIKNCLGRQKLKSGINDDVLDVALNNDGSTDLSASNTVDEASSHQGGHQGSSMKCTSKKKRRATDAASTAENKSGSVTSSRKPSHGRHLTCPVCEVVFLSCMDLLVHRLEQHGYVCGECDSRFLTLTRLKQHKEADHPLMLICSRCQFHTFRRSNLVDHVWSVHGVTMNETDPSKDETQSCGVIGGPIIDGTHARDTADAAVVQQKLNEDSSMKMLDLAKDMCAGKLGNVRNKQDSFVATSESADAIYHQGQVVNGQVFVDTKENKYSRRISLPESESFKDMVVAVSGQASSGPVFPSFSREVSDTVRSDLDTMSAMFAQVSQHCQLDSADFLNVSDQHASENEEPRLVIDTEVSCGKNAGRHGREQYKETVAARADEGRPAALAVHARSKDKSCNRGLRKSKTSRLTARARKHCLSDQELASGSSVEKEAQSKISDICMKEEGQVMNVAVEQGKERERLIMSISLKRKNSTSVYESHSRRRRKRRNGKSIVDSSTDVDCVEGGNSQRETCTEDSYSSKHFLSAKHTFCYDVPESSCDHISSSSDHMDKYARQQVKLGQLNVPTRDPFFQCRENIKTICPLVNHTEPPKNHLGKDAIDCPEKLDVKPAILGEPGINGCENSQSENVLSLTERHIMSSLPPKKRKLKKSSRARDVSSTVDNQNTLESGVSNMYTTQDADIGILEEGSFVRTEVHVLQTPDKKDNRRYTVVEENREDNCGGGDNQEHWMNDCQPGLVSNVGSDPVESGSQFVEHNQLLKINAGGFMGSCKGPLCHRWSMKEHMGRTQGKLPQIGCSVTGCDVKCLNKRDLRQHITIEHMGKTRKYMCSWPDCSKGFFARTHLSIHMLTHTGEKPVACDICDYRCRQRTALIWHLRKHGVFHKTAKVKNRKNSTTF